MGIVTTYGINPNVVYEKTLKETLQGKTGIGKYEELHEFLRQLEEKFKVIVRCRHGA